MSKYIIEIEEGKEGVMFCQSGIVSIGLHLEDEESLRGLGIRSAIPYTEPDMEKIKEEAYEDGYKTAKVQCNIQAEKDLRKVGERHYQKGLSDAWEAARKIALMDTETSENVTGYFGLFRIMENLTPMQAIEKIREYEQEQEKIKVGDEVISPDGKAVVTEISDRNVRIMYAKGSGQIVESENLTKTGRHFPEIAAVLAKMKEDTP